MNLYYLGALIKRYLVGTLLMFLTYNVHAIPLSFTITDPLGDHTGSIDLLSVEMFFDNATGDYDIFWNADAAAPFSGLIRINANFRNITLDGTLPRSPTFSDTLNDFNVLVPNTTQLMISGNSTELLRWNSGDEIAYILPGAGGFSISGVRGDDWGPSSPTSPMRTTFITGAVPEPATLTLMGLGFIGLGISRRLQIKA